MFLRLPWKASNLSQSNIHWAESSHNFSFSTNLFLCDGDANDINGHSTEGFAQASKHIFDARRLKVLVHSDPERGDVPAPVINAESYASAATELWARKFCKELMPPKNGYQT